MSHGHWQRISHQLIELSLTSTPMPPDLQRWEIRLDRDMMEVRLLDKNGQTRSTITLQRTAVDDVSFTQEFHEVE